MRRIKATHTSPEVVLRRELYRRGFRYRLHERKLPGKPDIVLPKARVAIQVRGCFWHNHACSRGHFPKSQKSYWNQKLLRNKRRDVRNDRQLRRMGWKLIVVWECGMRTKARLNRTIERVDSKLRSVIG